MKYELKKLFSEKSFVLLSVFLLAVNCILAYRAAPNDKDLLDAQNAFFADYSQNPSFYDKQYDEYLAAREQAISNQIEAVLRGEDPEAYSFDEPRTIAPDSGYTDIEFFTALYSRKDYGQRYREKLEQIIKETENNLSTVTDPGMTDYLQEVKNIYTRMSSLPHSQNQISGWESYFAYRDMGTLLLFAVAAGALLLATSDHDKGAEQILFACTKGFRGVALQKIAALFAFCLIGVVVFEGTSFLIFCTKTSFVGMGEFLASVESYMLCPCAVYIYEYALIRVAIRLLVLFSTGVLLLFVARTMPFSFGYLIICIALFGANFALDAKSNAIGSILSSLNLFHVLDPSGYFLQYASIKLGGQSIPLLTASIALCTSVIGVFSIGLLLLWKNPLQKKRFSYKLPSLPSYTPRTLAGFECKKLLIGQKLLLLLIALLAVKLFSCIEISRQTPSYREQLYQNYIQTLKGEANEEKDRFLKEEHAAFLTLFDEADAKRKQYENGELTYGAYASSTLALRNAEKEYEVFLEIQKEYERIKGLNAKGIPAKLVYTTGWKRLLLDGPDLLLLLATVSAAFAYSAENKDKTRALLHATPDGSTTMLGRKLAIFAVISVLICSAFCLLDLWSISRVYSLTEWGAVAPSIPALETVCTALTLRDMFLLLCVKKIALAATLTSVATCLSHATRGSLSAPLIYTAILFIPHGFTLLITDYADQLSIPNLFCLSPEFDANSLLLYIFLLSALVLLFLRARRAEK